MRFRVGRGAKERAINGRQHGSSGGGGGGGAAISFQSFEYGEIEDVNNKLSGN